MEPGANWIVVRHSSKTGEKVIRYSFPTALKLSLGLHKGGQAYIEALESKGCEVKDSAKRLLLHPQFSCAKIGTSVDLVACRPTDLGLNGAPYYSAVCDRIKEIRHALCPLEVGAALMLISPTALYTSLLIVM